MTNKAKKQQRGVQEVALGDVGRQQVELAKQFQPATDFVNLSARRDTTALHRGRASADVAQAFRGGTGEREAVQSGRLGSLVKLRKLKEQGTASAFASAKNRAILSRDKNVSQAVDLSLGKTAQSGRVTSQLAQEEFKNLSHKAKLAQIERDNRVGALTGVASLGLGVGMNKVNKERNARNDAAFAEALKTNPNLDYGTWTRMKGSGFEAGSGTNQFLSALGGV